MAVANRLTAGVLNSVGPAASATFNRPAATVDGDLIVVAVGINAGSIPTGPTGFTLYSAPTPAGDAATHWFIGVAAAGVTSWAFSASGTGTQWGLVGVYSGASTTIRSDARAFTAAATATSFTMPATTGQDGGMLLHSLMRDINSAFTSWPASPWNRRSAGNGGAGGQGGAGTTGDEPIVGSGTTVARSGFASTGTTGAASLATLAVDPSGAAPPVTATVMRRVGKFVF